jgi:hypothetical protein
VEEAGSPAPDHQDWAIRKYDRTPHLGCQVAFDSPFWIENP